MCAFTAPVLASTAPAHEGSMPSSACLTSTAWQAQCRSTTPSPHISSPTCAYHCVGGERRQLAGPGYIARRQALQLQRHLLQDGGGGAAAVVAPPHGSHRGAGAVGHGRLACAWEVAGRVKGWAGAFSTAQPTQRQAATQTLSDKRQGVQSSAEAGKRQAAQHAAAGRFERAAGMQAHVFQGAAPPACG